MIQPIGHFRVWRALYTKPIWLNSKLEQQVILMTLMAMANFKPNEWEWKGQKYKLKEGQFITSLESIRINTGGTVSIQNIRTALKRFEKLEFLTSESTKEGRLITLVNWQDYQYIEGQPNKEFNKDLTKSQQRPNKDLTPIEEGKKVKKVEKVIKEDIYIPIIEYLNAKSNKKYSLDAKITIKNIDARIEDGFVLADFKKVIDIKTVSWMNTHMEQYLRPETLFGNKFEGYLNENVAIVKTDVKNNNPQKSNYQGSVY